MFGCECCRFLVQARGKGNRISSQNADVTINVVRNMFPPVFVGGPYSKTIPCTAGSGYEVFTVSTTDADVVGTHRCSVAFLAKTGHVMSMVY